MAIDAIELVTNTKLPDQSTLAALIQEIGDAPDAMPLEERGASGADKEKSAQVNAGSLTSFTENLTGRNKQDVKNSTLWAQLGADYANDRYTKPMDWYKQYIELLNGVGWNMPSWTFDTYTTGGTTVIMDRAVLNILGAIATGDELAVMAATMNGLSDLSDDTKQMRIWNANSSDGLNGTFQIIPVDALPNGDVVMVMAGMQFTASENHSRFLWWSWDDSSIKIKRAATRFVLNQQVYSGVRSAIIDALGDNAKQLVIDTPIKRPPKPPQ